MSILSDELFYQLGLRQFGDISRIKLDPPPSLRELLEIAVEAENTESSALDKGQIVDVSYRPLSPAQLTMHYSASPRSSCRGVTCW